MYHCGTKEIRQPNIDIQNQSYVNSAPHSGEFTRFLPQVAACFPASLTRLRPPSRRTPLMFEEIIEKPRKTALFQLDQELFSKRNGGSTIQP